MQYRTTFHLLYRSWKGQQVIRWGRKGSDWIISFPAKEKRRAFLEIHCDTSPLIEDTVSAIVEYTDGSLFEFDGDIPANHPVNPLKKIPVTQRRLDVGKVDVHYVLKDDDSGLARWDLKLTGKLLHGDFSLTTTDGVMYTLTRNEAVKTEAEEVPPIYIPLKASNRFEVDAEKEPPVLEEAFAWIKEQEVDVLFQPKPNGFRTILDTRQNGEMFFEGNDENHADQYPDIMDAGKKLGKFVFDGELVSNSELHLFSMLFRDDTDLRNQSELNRYELLSKLKLEPPLYLMPSKKVSSLKELQALYASALKFLLSEGGMLKRADATNLQKWTVQWAKIKSVVYRVGEVLSQIPVVNRETFTYELGFKDAFDNVVSLGTSMTTSTLLDVGDHVIVSLPASGIWETPVVREKTDGEVDIFIPLKRVIESGTPLWVECENMEAEIPTASCSRLIEISTRCMEIYNYDYNYESERDYALDVYQQADMEHVKCHAKIVVPISLDFGDIPLEGRGTEYLEISNDGLSEGDQLFVSLSITGGDVYFQLTGETSAWVPGGQSSSFPVTGHATDPGPLNGEVSVSNSVGATKKVSLKMNGISGTGKVSLDKVFLSFGSVKVGNQAELKITLTNVGNGSLTVSNVQITGANASDFGFSDSFDGTYSPGEKKTMTVEFNPQSVTFKSAVLSFDTDGEPPTVKVSLDGKGV